MSLLIQDPMRMWGQKMITNTLIGGKRKRTDDEVENTDIVDLFLSDSLEIPHEENDVFQPNQNVPCDSIFALSPLSDSPTSELSSASSLSPPLSTDFLHHDSLFAFSPSSDLQPSLSPPSPFSSPFFSSSDLPRRDFMDPISPLSDSTLSFSSSSSSPSTDSRGKAKDTSKSKAKKTTRQSTPYASNKNNSQHKALSRALASNTKEEIEKAIDMYSTSTHFVTKSKVNVLRDKLKIIELQNNISSHLSRGFACKEDILSQPSYLKEKIKIENKLNAYNKKLSERELLPAESRKKAALEFNIQKQKTALLLLTLEYQFSALNDTTGVFPHISLTADHPASLPESSPALSSRPAKQLKSSSKAKNNHGLFKRAMKSTKKEDIEKAIKILSNNNPTKGFHNQSSYKLEILRKKWQVLAIQENISSLTTTEVNDMNNNTLGYPLYLDKKEKLDQLINQHKKFLAEQDDELSNLKTEKLQSTTDAAAKKRVQQKIDRHRQNMRLTNLKIELQEMEQMVLKYTYQIKTLKPDAEIPSLYVAENTSPIPQTQAKKTRNHPFTKALHSNTVEDITKALYHYQSKQDPINLCRCDILQKMLLILSAEKKIAQLEMEKNFVSMQDVLSAEIYLSEKAEIITKADGLRAKLAAEQQHTLEKFKRNSRRERRITHLKVMIQQCETDLNVLELKYRLEALINATPKLNGTFSDSSAPLETSFNSADIPTLDTDGSTVLNPLQPDDDLSNESFPLAEPTLLSEEILTTPMPMTSSLLASSFTPLIFSSMNSSSQSKTTEPSIHHPLLLTKSKDDPFDNDCASTSYCLFDY